MSYREAVFTLAVAVVLVAAACVRETAVSDGATATDTNNHQSNSIDAERYDQYEIVTLRPRFPFIFY